ncbi:MAG TPA: 3-phosphoshikimate 1-carboxyvinyltransferase, partial [Candidatus Caccousia stercoris]|nr:3-phosphoshikimate 1-carboxyvinyltransferase [Candidatus Caccousia stercoris]
MDADRVTLLPGRLNGCVDAPPSKSAAHRAILCAALAALSSPGETESILSPLALSDDIRATLCAAHALGVRAVLENGVCTVSAGTRPTGTVSLDCGESGSTLRFLIPIAAALGIPAVFTGHGRLPDRPIGIYTELLPQHGVSCRTQGGLPLAIEGRLQPGCFSLPGNVSSQFITGLLLALPLLPEDSEICLTTPLESAAYVAMTVQAMDAFGVHVERTANGWHVPGQQSYRPCRHTVEGDWSQAAFFLAAGALGG